MLIKDWYPPRLFRRSFPPSDTMPVAPIPVCRGAALADFQVGVLKPHFQIIIGVLRHDCANEPPAIGVPETLGLNYPLVLNMDEIRQIGMIDSVAQADRLIGELWAKLGSAARFIGVSILGHRIFTGPTAPL